MKDIYLRSMNMSDIDEVERLENVSFSSPWSRDHFYHEIESPLSFPLVARTSQDKLAGYICPMLVLDEGQILDIAVHPDFRNQGIGKFLVKEALNEFFRRGAAFVALEVRKSNSVAINIYCACGFEIIGTRIAYYRDGEDAILMEFKTKAVREGNYAV